MSKKSSWEVMLAEKGARSRIERESPATVKVLDFLASRKKIFTDGKGWTVFNDWLDETWRYMDRRPEDIPGLTDDQVRMIVFPACR